MRRETERHASCGKEGMRAFIAGAVFSCACAQNSGPGRESIEPDTGPRGSDAGFVEPADECGNGFDDDGDSAIDEGCACVLGTTQPCHPDRATGGVGACRRGVQRCVSSPAIPAWGECMGSVLAGAELCDNGWDEDCDGTIDDGCPGTVELPVDLAGDCVSVSCPASAPYPVGCMIAMEGEDPRGCVAARAEGPSVYFQEGNACGAGRVTGRLVCSSTRGSGLDEGNCRIDKVDRFYPTDPSGCPALEE
jgi:hypothetical protein